MKILFVIDALRQGGIRVSLLNLLSNLKERPNDSIYLFAFHLTDDDIKNIPTNITVIKSNWLLDILASTGTELRNKSLLKFFLRLFFSLLSKIFGAPIIYKIAFMFEKKSFFFDIAISFTNNVDDHSLYFGANKFVLEKVDALKKVTWLHADYEKFRLNTNINNLEYSKFDCIICVSKQTRDIFLKYNPFLKGKTHVIYNMIDVSRIKTLANVQIEEKFNTEILNCISVMRLDSNKDPLFLIEIFNELKKNGFAYNLRILGDGPLFSKVNSKIKEYQLENSIKLYGYIDNPFPYLKQSNVYICTSSSEGYSLSIIEALYFKLHIVCSNFNSVNEILNSSNGVVVPKEIDKFYEIISNNHKIFMKKKEVYILHSNDEILKNIEEIIYN